MPDFQDELIFHIDFNNVQGDLVKGSLRHASHARIPDVGERTLVRDHEGNQCEAVVVELRGPIVYFELDEATWSTSGDLQATGIATSGHLVFA